MRILISLSVRKLQKNSYITVSKKTAEEFCFHCQQDGVTHTAKSNCWLASLEGRGGGGQGLSLLRAPGWESPILSPYHYRKHFPVSDTGFSSVVGDGRRVPCLGLAKNMVGDGEKKSLLTNGISRYSYCKSPTAPIDFVSVYEVKDTGQTICSCKMIIRDRTVHTKDKMAARYDRTNDRLRRRCPRQRKHLQTFWFGLVWFGKFKIAIRLK